MCENKGLEARIKDLLNKDRIVNRMDRITKFVYDSILNNIDSYSEEDYYSNEHYSFRIWIQEAIKEYTIFDVNEDLIVEAFELNELTYLIGLRYNLRCE